MFPSPLGSQYHSQTYLNLLEWLRFELSSLQIFTQQNLSKLFGTWIFLSLELPTHGKASSQGQTLVHAQASQEKMPNSLKKSDFKLK